MHFIVLNTVFILLTIENKTHFSYVRIKRQKLVVIIGWNEYSINGKNANDYSSRILLVYDNIMFT